jgi:cytochrome P450
MEAVKRSAGPELQALLGSLVTPSVSADPYQAFAAIRENGPVRWAAAGDVTVLTGYEDCAALVRDRTYASQSPEWCDQVQPGWREHRAKTATFEAMLFRDPPDHTRLRRLVSAAFTPRQAERMRADVTVHITRTLDQLADAGADGGTINLPASECRRRLARRRAGGRLADAEVPDDHLAEASGNRTGPGDARRR